MTKVFRVLNNVLTILLAVAVNTYKWVKNVYDHKIAIILYDNFNNILLLINR